MPPLLSCHDLSKAHGHDLLFAGVTLSIDTGEHIGLIGSNGAGKSTLLHILAGLEPADEGQVVLGRERRLALVAQDTVFAPGQSAREVVERELDPLGLDEVERGVRSQQELRRAGFADLDVPTDSLSGGWRKRLDLCRALASRPDLLLLDEPTNHLDIEGIEWLEQILSRHSGAYVLVTHDRFFLESCTQRIIEIGRGYAGGTLSVDGPYSRFVQRRAEYLEAQHKLEASLASRMKRELAWLQRGPKARTTKARARIEQADELGEQLAQVRQRNREDGAPEIDFASTGRRSKRLLVARGLSFAYEGGDALFSDVDLTLAPGQRVGLLGGNGSGKSTFLKLLAGELKPSRGRVEPAPLCRRLYFEQDRSTLDPDATLRTTLAPDGDSVVYRGRSQHVVGFAKRFLFCPEQLDLPVARLSGGEKARLLIARLMLQEADVLLLDEPTNDLDIASLQVLESSLTEFAGAVVLVSHDRFLLDQVCTSMLGLEGGQAVWCADREQWRQIVLKRQALRREATKNPRAARPRAPAQKARLSYMEARELAALEPAIEVAESQLAELQSQVEDPEISSKPVRLTAVVEQMHEAQQKLDAMYARWEELAEKQTGSA